MGETAAAPAPDAERPPDDDRPGRRTHLAVLALIGVVAIGLRVWHLRAGLPGAALLYPDEGTVVPKSIGLITTSLNPKWFLYPSGFFMLLASTLTASQALLHTNPKLTFASNLSFQDDPTPYILTGRVLSVLAGVGFVVAAYLIAREVCGRRWALMAATLATLCPLAIRFSHYAVADMTMACLLAFAIRQLLVSTRSGAYRDVLIAAALLGLAVTMKYNAGLFVVPLLAWALLRPGPRRVRRRLGETAVAGLTAGVMFVAGTPYSVLDWRTFGHGLAVQNTIQGNGWLGYENVRSGFLYNIHPNLTTAMGVVALLLVGVGLVVGLRRHSAVDLLLWPYAIGTYLYVSPWQQTADRYLLTVLAVLPAAAALGAQTIVRRVPRHYATRAAAGVVVAALAQPAYGAAHLMRDLARPEYRLSAIPQIEQLIPQGARVATDSLTPPLLDAPVAQALIRADGRSRYFITRTPIYQPQPGLPEHTLRDMCVLNARRVHWAITSDSIRSRVRAAGANRYPRSLRFYDELARFADERLVIPAGLGPGARVWEFRPLEIAAYCQAQGR